MSLKYAFPFDVHYSLILAILYILHTLIEHVLTFPLIYRAFLLSPEKHDKSGDYCTLILGPMAKYFLSSSLYQACFYNLLIVM